jgi:hypothetical protein
MEFENLASSIDFYDLFAAKNNGDKYISNNLVSWQLVLIRKILIKSNLF